MSDSVAVAHISELKTDSGNVVIIGGREIALFVVDGCVFAIDNECPHREGPLGEGDLEGDIVTCPFHAWEINVRTGEVVDFPEMCARTYPSRIADGQVFVELS